MPKEAVDKSEREHVYNDVHKNDQPGDLVQAVSLHVDGALFFFLGTKRPTKDNKQFFFTWWKRGFHFAPN